MTEDICMTVLFVHICFLEFIGYIGHEPESLLADLASGGAALLVSGVQQVVGVKSYFEISNVVISS